MASTSSPSANRGVIIAIVVVLCCLCLLLAAAGTYIYFYLQHNLGLNSGYSSSVTGWLYTRADDNSKSVLR